MDKINFTLTRNQADFLLSVLWDEIQYCTGEDDKDRAEELTSFTKIITQALKQQEITNNGL